MNGNLFTGDTLFAGSVGRTDILGGSMKELLDSLKKYLLYQEKLLCFQGTDLKQNWRLKSKQILFIMKLYKILIFIIVIALMLTTAILLHQETAVTQ